jgi:hypothetical protein
MNTVMRLLLFFVLCVGAAIVGSAVSGSVPGPPNTKCLTQMCQGVYGGCNQVQASITTCWPKMASNCTWDNTIFTQYCSGVDQNNQPCKVVYYPCP